MAFIFITISGRELIGFDVNTLSFSSLSHHPASNTNCVSPIMENVAILLAVGVTLENAFHLTLILGRLFGCQQGCVFTFHKSL